MTDRITELSDLHEVPWSGIKGAYLRVGLATDNRDPLDIAEDPTGPEARVTTKTREGELVGRAEGQGLYYDKEEAANIPTSIGPAVYLSTPEDTILEVRTERLGNELLGIEQEDGGE